MIGYHGDCGVCFMWKQIRWSWIKYWNYRIYEVINGLVIKNCPDKQINHSIYHLDGILQYILVLRRPTSSFIVWHMSTLISFTWHPYGFHMIWIYQVVYNASLYKGHAGSNWERSQWMYTYAVKEVPNGSRYVSIGGTG